MQQDVTMTATIHQSSENHQVAQEDDTGGICAADSSSQDDEMQSAMGTADNYSMQEEDLRQLSDAGILKKDVTCNGLSEGCPEKSLPVCIEGREVNLLQLWTDVLAHGGYQKVTDSAMWPSLSERLGFEKNCGVSLKSVYAKHLNMYERRLMMKNGLHIGVHVDCSASKSVEESSTGLVDGNVIKDVQSNSPESSACHTDRNVDTPSKRRRLSYVKEEQGSGSNSLGHKASTSTEGLDAFVGMIKWIKRLALNPGDPKKGQGPRGSKRNEAWVESCSTMMMKVRMVLWGRKEFIHYGGLSGNMGKQRIPPKEYYRELAKPNPKALEKLRANQTRAMKCGLHISGDVSDGQAVHSAWLCQTPSWMSLGGSGHGIDRGLDLSSAYVKSMNEALNIGYVLDNKISRKRIPIGPHFQAPIPPCLQTDEDAGKETDGEESSGSSGTAFGGTLVWPIRGSQGKRTHDNIRVGTGRHLTCVCRDPMSVDCVRLHIQEEREKLKKELGEVYDSWGFDDMGEIVANRWTKEEEHVFDLMVKMNPASLGKNFWDVLPNALPSKSLKELVSYYFNVFVIRRRAIENRTMPDSIDSDDDERDLVISGNGSPFKENAIAGYWQDLMMPDFFGFSHCRELLSSATSCPPMQHGEK